MLPHHFTVELFHTKLQIKKNLWNRSFPQSQNEIVFKNLYIHTHTKIKDMEGHSCGDMKCYSAPNELEQNKYSDCYAVHFGSILFSSTV